MLTVGLVGGWEFARSPIVERLPAAPSEVVPQPIGGDALRRSASDEELTLTVVDRTGRPLRTIAANRPWTPRFSPDGRHVAYGAFGSGRSTSDVWVTDIDAGTTRRLTDDGNDSNDPQWSPKGTTVAYSVSASDGKDLEMRPVGAGNPTVLATRPGTQFASDWLRDGSALLVTEETGDKHDILVQPADGSTPWSYAATSADETAARVSPDGRWVAYTSDESGHQEVYLDAYPRPWRRVTVSRNGGAHPVWRGDGRELYYWNDGALVAVRVTPAADNWPPAIGAPTILFRAQYYIGPNTMYDVSPDGERFVIVQSASAGH
jgi:dipeptidyl aminopeptidase/acylaminoacyl peptidase